MEKSYQYRIYPNASQVAQIEATFNAVRFVHNEALATKKNTYKETEKSLSCYDLIKMLPAWKQQYEWLKPIDATALQNEIKTVNQAYNLFFKQHNESPRFMSKHKPRLSYTTNNVNNSIHIDGLKKIKLPKLGWVKCKISCMPKGRILNATVKRKASGKYFVLVCCTDVKMQKLPVNNKAVGIDLGCETLITTSDGKKIENPHPLRKCQKKLAREQRRLSRKKKGSKNKEKQRLKVARINERIANIRQDHIHKATSTLVSENQVICAETLRPKNMVKNYHLAKTISDSAFGEIARQLEYKCEWYGRTFVQIDTFYPSTKTCSCCGNVQDIPLSKRTYKCEKCGMVLDRDINAAINILQEGIRKLGWDTPEVNACGECVRPTFELATLAETRIPCL